MSACQIWKGGPLWILLFNLHLCVSGFFFCFCFWGRGGCLKFHLHPIILRMQFCTLKCSSVIVDFAYLKPFSFDDWMLKFYPRPHLHQSCELAGYELCTLGMWFWALKIGLFWLLILHGSNRLARMSGGWNILHSLSMSPLHPTQLNSQAPSYASRKPNTWFHRIPTVCCVPG